MMSRFAQPSSSPVLPVAAVYLEAVDAELTTQPLMAFLKVAVKPPGCANISHHVMKCHADFQELHDAMVRELGCSRQTLFSAALNDMVADTLPNPPPPRPEPEVASQGFRSQLNTYLAHLTRHNGACSTHAFLNFFQLSAEYVTSEMRPRTADELQQSTAYRPSLNRLQREELHQSDVPRPGVPERHPAPRVRLPSKDVYLQQSPPHLTPIGQHLQPSATSTASCTNPMPASHHRPTAGSGSANWMGFAFGNEELSDGKSMHSSRRFSAESSRRSSIDSLPSYSGDTSLPPRAVLPEVRSAPSQQSRYPGPILPCSEVSASASGGFSQPFGSSSFDDVNGLSTNGSTFQMRQANAISADESQIRRPSQTQSLTVARETSASSSNSTRSPTKPEMMSAVSEESSFGSEYGVSGYSSTGVSTSRQNSKKTSRRRPWCVICMAQPQEMAIDPCGHMSMCQGCCVLVKICPVCRGPIDKALRVFMA